MKKTLSSIERLNVAAGLRRSGVWSNWLLLLFLPNTIYDFEKIPLPNITLSVILSGAVFLTVIILAFAMRYQLYAVTMWFFILAAYPVPFKNHGILPFMPHWMGPYPLVLLLIFLGCSLLKTANDYAEVN